MDSKIQYASIDQQIEKLKSQNLIIDDEDFAKTSLWLYGYSNLIKGYRTPYTTIVDGQIRYLPGVTFRQISSLYSLDKALRNGVMASMLDLEEHIKEVTAEVVAKSFGTHPDQYLEFRNYQNKKKSKYRFSLPGILDTMKETLNTDKNPIQHYALKYGCVPPWILFKSIYFSTIVNYIDLLKFPEQQALISGLYSINTLSSCVKDFRKLLHDTLFICLEYRNLSAHGGRTYNYICKSKLRISEIFYNDAAENVFGFSQLFFLLNFFKYKNPAYNLNSILQDEINRHCNDYPQDISYLEETLNIKIKALDTVPNNPVPN